MAIRIPINLATEPFRRDRPILIASAAAAILLTISLVSLAVIIVNQRSQSARIRVDLDRLTMQSGRIAADQAKLDAILRKPEDAEVLDRSLFLNSLIERKGISWTLIFSELEKVMPSNVRLVSVRLPQVNTQNQVVLDMMVGADSFAPVLEMMKRMDKAPEFGPTTVLSTTPPSQTDKLWKYRVSVNYAQKL